MCRKWMLLSTVVLLVGLVNIAAATTIYWTGNGVGASWCTAENWNPVGIPGSGDDVIIDVPDPCKNTCVINCDATCHKLTVGLNNGPCLLNISSGNVAVSGDLIIGENAGSDGSVYKTGGTLSVSGDFKIGKDGKGTFNKNGGDVYVAGHMEIGGAPGSEGDVYYSDSGVINTHTFGMRATGGIGTMEFLSDSFTVVIDGDVVTQIEGYITSGWITAYGGAGTLNVDYNVTNPGKTTITANSPEKASHPSPANGAECVDPNTTLTWSPGAGAMAHDVYFGTDYNSVNNATTGSPMGVYKGRQVSTTYSPGTLGACMTYYWRIDEVNVPIIVKGNVWHFKTGGSCCRCIYPPPNMAAWWPLDENEGDISEEMIHNNDGTWMGSPTPVAGKVAGALDFNDAADYVEVPDNAFLDFGTGDFSIDAWVQTSDACGTYAIVDKRSGPILTTTGYVLFIYNGNLAFQWGFNAGNINYFSSLFVADDNWRHVAVTVDRDDPCGLKLYVNGVSQTFNPTAQQGKSLDNDGNLLIASDRYTTSHRFNGSIDEVELFKRALTAAEVNAIYQAGSAGKCKCEQAPTAFRDDIKWSQPPVTNGTGCINGWDENSIYYTGPVIADDWICKDNRPITNIHWWGSFKGWTGDVPPPDKPIAFHIGIWTNVPDPNRLDPNNFSHPGRLIWENICDCSAWSYFGCDVDPRNIDQNETCFRFDQMLSQDQWFYQDSNAPRGRVYWLSIAAIYDGNTPPVHQWGWKTRPRFYSDDAVRILPPVAKCPNDCNSPNLSVFPAGTPDNFTLPAEAASPSPSLITFLGANLLRNFDETVNNQRFGHTFTGLPPCIKAATLEIRLKATGDNPSTDSLTLELVSLVPPKAAWGISILNLPLNPGWPITGSWEVNDVNTFTLNLANLPPNGSSILDYMNKNGGKLDVWLQDDTAFDYMILRVWSCPLVTDWPPAVTSLWENGQPIEYPPGTSWDTAFVLTSNRNYTPRLGIWPQAETISSDATPVSQIDFNEDLIINFQDFAVMAGEWLDEGEIWPEYDMP